MPLAATPPYSGSVIWPRQRPAGGVAASGQQPRRPLLAPPRAIEGGAQHGRRRGRHPELAQLAAADANRRGPDGGAQVAGASPATAVVEQPRPEEVDERYRRADYSDVFQFESRQAFARCIAGGEPQMRLAEAALHVTAEDDAIASHSTVRFPVGAWMERIEALAEGISRCHMRRAAAAAATSGSGSGPGSPGGAASGPAGAAADGAVAAEAAAVLRVAERYLYEEVGFRMPEYGRSKLPPNAVVDHPGVWEDPRLAYLNEVLIRRLGHPAALALLLGEVATRLLARGVLPCAATIDTRSYMQLPRAVPLPGLTRELLMGGCQPQPHSPAARAGAAADGAGGYGSGGLAGLNTCTSEVLAEMLRHLKRSYWPFAWDSSLDAAYPHAPGSHGGFRAAAKAAMGDDVSAALTAIGKVAAWRLERGIWTSPGAGDLRRARAASERLVLLAGDTAPEERRDLAVLLLHCGDLAAARTELRTYLRSVSDTTTPRGSSASASTPAAVSAPLSSTPSARAGAADPRVGPWVGGDPPGPDPFDLLLCRRLLEAWEGSWASMGLRGLGEGEGEGKGEGEGEGEALGLEATLRAVPPWERPAREEGGGSGGGGGKRYLPLTW